MMVSWPEPLDPDSSSKRSRNGWTLLLIGSGGAIGTLVRFLIETAIPPVENGWPTATFIINISGAFILAVLLETLSRQGRDAGWRRRIRLGVGTGVMGGYTTYSSFMVEAALLGRADQYLVAFAYVVISVVLGLIAALAGLALVAAVDRRHSGATS